MPDDTTPSPERRDRRRAWAIASAMGRQAVAVQRLLALSNVRLGTWLPNPAFLADRKSVV